MDKSNQKIEILKIDLNSKLPPPKIWDEEKIWSFGYNKLLLGYLNAYFDHCPIKVNPNIIINCKCIFKMCRYTFRIIKR